MLPKKHFSPQCLKRVHQISQKIVFFLLRCEPVLFRAFDVRNKVVFACDKLCP